MSFEKRPEASALFEGSTPLEISAGSVTLDSSVAPYCLSDLTLPLLDPALLEELDPYANQRVKVTASAAMDGNDERDFDLVLTGRKVSHDGRNIDLELGSDEAILQRYSDVTDNIDAFAFQSSLRSVINLVLGDVIPGAALQPGALDSDVTTYTDATNLIVDPGTAATAGGGYSVSNASPDFQDTSWSISGDGDSFNIYNPTSADSYMAVGGATGSLFSGLTPGKTYVFSATGNVKAAFTGTNLPIDASDMRGSGKSRVRALVVHTLHTGAAGYSTWNSEPVPNVVNTPTRVSVEFTVPEGVTQLFLRAYLGNTAGQIRWDGFRLSEKDTRPGVDNTSYFDGDTPLSDAYRYEWSGVQDNSTSRRISRIDRAPELLIWEAGVTAWDFLTPIVATAGYRLWCDEKRRWWLIDPAEYSVPGRVVAQISNTSVGTDTIDANSGLFYTGVVLVYEWTDAQGVQQTARDVAGTGPYVYREEIRRPYPGPGRAAARLAKYQGQGRTQDVTVGADYTVSPGMEVGITLPGTYSQIGTLQSVTWALKDGVMELGSTGLRETPPGAIDLLTGSIDSLTGTINAL